MKLFDVIWNKVESGFLGFFAGTIWCFIFYPVFKNIYPELNLSIYYLVFITSFITVSVFFKKFIEYSGLGALYALFGYLSVLLHIDALALEIDGKKLAKEVFVCLVIGISAGVITIYF